MSRRRLAPALILLLCGGLLVGLALWVRDAINDLHVYRATPHTPGAPTLILLHGYGAPGGDMMDLGKRLSTSLPGVQIIAPEGRFDLVGSGRAWFVESKGEAVESRGELADVIDRVLIEGTPRGQIVVAGFSQGGTMAIDIGLFHESVGCVASLSGAPLGGVGWESQLHRGTVPDVFIAHGRKDRTVAFSAAEDLAAGLKKAGAAVEFVPHGGGHEVPQEVEEKLATFVQRCFD